MNINVLVLLLCTVKIFRFVSIVKLSGAAKKNGIWRIYVGRGIKKQTRRDDSELKKNHVHERPRVKPNELTFKITFDILGTLYIFKWIHVCKINNWSIVSRSIFLFCQCMCSRSLSFSYSW